MDELEQDTNKVYFIPVPLVTLVVKKPESALFLLLKLYEKVFPDSTAEDYYEAIENYLNQVKFEMDGIMTKPPENTPVEEQN